MIFKNENFIQDLILSVNMDFVKINKKAIVSICQLISLNLLSKYLFLLFLIL